MEKASNINTIIYGGTAILVTLTLVLIILVLFYQNRLSKIKTIESELLLKTALDSEKKERSRIAADIHDGISGDLNAIRMYLAVLKLEDPSEKQENIYGIIEEGLRDANENINRISYSLMPPLLEQGLFLALEDYLKSLQLRSGVVFNITDASNNFYKGEGKAYEIYRVIQEMTTNMIKHGEVSECEIVISNEGNLKIIDDGIIFSFIDANLNSSGAGMKNINSRLHAINASIHQVIVEKGNQFIIRIENKNA